MQSEKLQPGLLLRASVVQLLMIVQAIRANMKKMGELAGVPIEPPEQTELLDACLAQVGVIGGGVPGGMLLKIIFEIRLITGM